MWSLMSRKRSMNSRPDSIGFTGFRWIECYVETAINPVTKNQVTLTTPVKIGSYEDFAKFNVQWEEFCNILSGDPDEVFFTLT